jgi:hypothetical protein
MFPERILIHVRMNKPQSTGRRKDNAQLAEFTPQLTICGNVQGKSQLINLYQHDNNLAR